MTTLKHLFLRGIKVPKKNTVKNASNRFNPNINGVKIEAFNGPFGRLPVLISHKSFSRSVCDEIKYGLHVVLGMNRHGKRGEPEQLPPLSGCLVCRPLAMERWLWSLKLTEQHYYYVCSFSLIQASCFIKPTPALK